jgi:hypothetical protein
VKRAGGNRIQPHGVDNWRLARMLVAVRTNRKALTCRTCLIALELAGEPVSKTDSKMDTIKRTDGGMTGMPAPPGSFWYSAWRSGILMRSYSVTCRKSHYCARMCAISKISFYTSVYRRHILRTHRKTLRYVAESGEVVGAFSGALNPDAS